MNSYASGIRILVVAVITLACGLPSAGADDARETPLIGDLSDSTYWTFQKFRGEGTVRFVASAEGPVVELAASGSEGMAASLRSPRFPVEPNRQYTMTMDVRTEGLEAIDANLTGAAYLLFWDGALLPGSYQPSDAVSTRAPRDSGWHAVSQTVTTPTTARSAELHLAFAAYGPYTQTLRPRTSGRAKGRLWIRNVHVEGSGRVTPLPPSIGVSEPLVQAAVDTVADCLHNASINGIFVDSDGYSDSSNIVPDLSFGLYGVRRQGQPRYLEILRKQWEELGSSADAEGKLPQRVMSQVLFPIGVDEIFSFTGDQAFLAKLLPVADRALEYVNTRADRDGLVRLVEHGQWQIGEGADWVDWYPTRMEGKTFNFHQWYVRALRRMAALHDELSASGTRPFASARRAGEYRALADRIEASLRTLYWADDHFVTNVDYGGKIADQRWMDDQLWAIRLGIATPEQARKIWSWIDAESADLEAVPTRWAAFDGPQHGPLTWFGRTGGGDILARYRSGDPARGLALLKRISELFVRDHNVYEAYTMFGTVAPGTLGWGNYTEHCGGYIWSLIEGPFGLDFDSDRDAVATLKPRFPEEWDRAEARVYVRGTRVRIEYARTGGKTTVSLSGEEGEAQPIRIMLPGGGSEIIRLGAGARRTFPP